MKKVKITILLTFISLLKIEAQNVTLTKKWETEPVLRVPESVIYDSKNDFLYVSNIDGQPWEKDGRGSIARISLEGKIIDIEWIKGLDAPKGMGLFNNKLFVADITKLVIIDIVTNKIERTIEIDGAINLNDITTDENGNVYISDSVGKKVFKFSNQTISLFLENSEWIYPNGILALNKKMLFADMQAGKLFEIDMTNKVSKLIAENVTSADGIIEIAKNEYLVSNWNGEINYVSNGIVTKILDTKEAKISAADIWYIASRKMVLIPTFFTNKVTAYTLEGK